MKVPYMLVVGENEMKAEQVSLRVRDGSAGEQHPAGRVHRTGQGSHPRRAAEL